MILSDPLFQALFNSPVPRIIVKADAPIFTIVVNNEAHKRATNLMGQDISGKSVWEVFDPVEAGETGGYLLKKALTEAQETNKTVLMPPFRYDMPSIDQQSIEIKWWQLEIIPIGGNSTPEYLLATTNNITEQILKQQQIEDGCERERSLNEELTKSITELHIINDKLNKTVEELHASQDELHRLNTSLEHQINDRTKELTENESQFSGLVTEQINSRRELERIYEQASLSKKAAQLGTFDMDLLQGTMEWDARCRELFGISHENPVTYDNDFLPGLHPEDAERVKKIISDLFDKSISNGDYDVEYRTIGTEDGKLRWVRAKGKVFFNDADQAVRFIGSVFEITDQKQNEQRKNDFIGMVSHELKTPLTSLTAYIQMLQRIAAKQPDKQTIIALSQADKQVKKMTSMINSFLDLSRLESGKLLLDLQEVDLNNLIQEVLDDIKPTAMGRKFVFSPIAALPIRGDIGKIAHVISNLLSNSVKYSSEGSSIQINSLLNKEFALVTVQDQGMGINSNDLDKLFDRYYRVEGENTKFISGFGIGLYLSAEIVHLHGGRIWVESEVEQGSTFYFTLPVK